MSGITLALLGFAVMLALIAIRCPIGLSMLVVGAVGYMQLSSGSAFLAYIKTNTYHQFANYTLSVIPLFILMGALAERCGNRHRAVQIGGMGIRPVPRRPCHGGDRRLHRVRRDLRLLGRHHGDVRPGRHAGAAKYRYDGGFATGTIAVGGTLGILIPPSVILVVYAITTEQNIAKLFQAALIPGLLAASSTAWPSPGGPPQAELAPRQHVRVEMPRSQWPMVLGLLVRRAGRGRGASRRSTPSCSASRPGPGGRMVHHAGDPIAVVVVGGIYGGVFTPTEGAAVGAIAMLAAGLAQRTLGWASSCGACRPPKPRHDLPDPARRRGVRRLPGAVAAADDRRRGGRRLRAPALRVLIGCWSFYILLGAVMDELAMMLLTLPVFFPVVQALDFGMLPDDVAIWFGILVLIVVGIGLTAPPIGLNVFVICSMARNVPLAATYRGVLPFIATDVVRLALSCRIRRCRCGWWGWLS